MVSSRKLCLSVSAMIFFVSFVLIAVKKQTNFVGEVSIIRNDQHDSIQVSDASFHHALNPNHTTHNSKSSAGRVKLMMLTYMRGGSSLLGDIFNNCKDTFHWFEPFDSLQYSIFGTRVEAPIDVYYKKDRSIRQKSGNEEAILSDFTKGLYDCDPHWMSLALLDSLLFSITRQHAFARYAKCKGSAASKDYSKASTGKCEKHLQGKCQAVFTTDDHVCEKRISEIRSILKMIGEVEFSQGGKTPPISYKNTTLDEKNQDVFAKYGRCLANHYRSNAICWESLTKSCKEAKIISVKAIRLRAKSLVKTLEKNPDIKVIYYTRDPRGIINSRMHTFGVSSKLGARNNTREAELLCQMMDKDYETLKEAKEKFGHNIFFTSYENLMLDSDTFVKKVFDFLNIPLPEKTRLWVHSMTHHRALKKNSEDVFGTIRSDPEKTAFRWKATMSKKVRDDVTKVCHKTLHNLGYI